MGGIPSTNALPLTQTLLLVGCSDGTLKCFDRALGKTMKSIKGLGKGDWMVQLIPANPLDQSLASKRMLTVTKKGAAYLIDIEVGENGAVEIKPPLARFVGGWPENTDPILEFSLIKYDAARDWIVWFQPHSPSSVLYVWNLHALRKDFVLADPKLGGVKPDPTLHIPIQGNGHLIDPIQQAGAAWGDSSTTLLFVNVSPTTGTLLLQAVMMPFTVQAQHTSQAVQSVTILEAHLPDLLARDAGIMDLETQEIIDQLNGTLRIHSVRTQSLGPSSNELLIGTNLGILLMQFPVPPLNGARHIHFGAGLGSLGKSILTVQGSDVMYASLDTLIANPVGFLEPKNLVDVYNSPLPVHMPVESQRKRLFRTGTYSLIHSPSGTFVTLLWHAEYKYEILHIPSLLQRVGQVRGMNKAPDTRSACVASDVGVTDFAWVGDQDIFAVLHVPGWHDLAAELTPPEDEVTQSSGGIAVLGASVKNVAQTATLAATSIKTIATNKTVNKGLQKASFGLLGRKKKKGKDQNDDDASELFSNASTLGSMSVSTSVTTEAKAKKRYVELRQLIGVDPQAVELSHSVAPATSSTIGELSIRGGKRNIPIALFGGPVLCVGTRSEDNHSEEGSAQFYSTKKGEKGDRAAAYSATGPTIPFPDMCAWDDDGRMCAVATDCRVAIYLLDGSNFVLLGAVRISSPSLPTAQISSLKFVHGALFCCTWNSVHLVLMGSLTHEICRLDSYLLASSDVPILSSDGLNPNDDASLRFAGTLAPTPVCLPLIQPAVLGFQSGSLIVSSLRGVFAIPLHHPIVRIGLLLCSGQVERATKWLDAIPDCDHESMAQFLERRGYVDLALKYLPGISLETVVDLSMRYGDLPRLVEVVETFGARGLRAIDMGRGLSDNAFTGESNPQTVIVCVGAYLLGHGQIEVVRRLASECLRYDDEQGRKDAFFLGALMLPVNESDANRVISRAVESCSDDWIIGKFVREFILKKVPPRM